MSKPAVLLKFKLIRIRTIERNLDSICRTPRLNREELLRYTHRPMLIQESFDEVEQQKPSILQSLETRFHLLSIFDDPWIKHLQADPRTTEEYLRKVVLKGETSCRAQLKKLITASNTVLRELGPWASERYLLSVINAFQSRTREQLFYIDSVEQSESDYLSAFFENLALVQEYPDSPNTRNISPKVNVLVDLLLQELQQIETLEDDEVEETRSSLTGIVFVETRIVVCVLKLLLQCHPSIKDQLRLGLSFGTSAHPSRKNMMSDCVMKDKSIEDIEVVLDDLRSGAKNLLISTNVVEEGIDITACNRIISFDPPKNLVSFVQRRGRARDAKSKYFIMFPRNQVATGVAKWQQAEEEMIKMYMDQMREIQELDESESLQGENRVYHVETTGYVQYVSFLKPMLILIY